MIYYPLIAVLRGIACTYYLILGKLLYDICYKLKRLFSVMKYHAILFLTSLCSFALSVYFSRFLVETNFSLLKLGREPYMLFLCGSFGSIGVISLFYLLCKLYSFPILQYIGRKSMIIMGTHMSMLLTIGSTAFLNVFISTPKEQSLSYYVYGLGCVIFMIILEIPIIWLFDNRLRNLVSSCCSLKEYYKSFFTMYGGGRG